MTDPLNLVGVAEIQQLLDLSRARVDQLVRQKGFPDPAVELKAGRIWRREDVEQWAREKGRIK